MGKPEAASQLHRVLGTWDLVLLNIAAIVRLRWLSTVAQIGPSSLLLWSIGFLLFFIPLAFAVLELSAPVPGEGGLYLWAKAGFGDIHGFVAGWSYWVQNLVYFPSALLFSAGDPVEILEPGVHDCRNGGRGRERRALGRLRAAPHLRPVRHGAVERR